MCDLKCPLVLQFSSFFIMIKAAKFRNSSQTPLARVSP